MRPTASKHYLLQRCLWWAGDSVPWAESSGEAAELGTRVHAAIEAGLMGIGEAPAADVAPYVHSYVAWRDRVHGERLVGAETAWALDIETGKARELAQGEHREYVGRRPTDVVGTSDQLWMDEHGVYIVDDVKTGRPENVEDIAENAQMRTLGLLAARARGVDEIRIRLVFVSPLFTYTQEARLDAFDLDAWEGQLREWAAAFPAAVPTPGKPCQYCPAAMACPVATDAIERLASTALAAPRRLPIVANSSAFEGPEHAAYQYGVLRALDAARSQAWEALRRYVEERGPIEVASGIVYGPKVSEREQVVIETPAQIAALKAALGEDWEAAVSIDTSKTAIRAAAKLAAERRGGKIAPIERATLEALRAVGAVQTKTTKTYEEQKA